jgi:hypothetical protein
MRFQIYWSNWWQLCPTLVTHPADENDPKERFLTWSIFQFNWYVYTR